MHLIIGLGNIGREYEATRHNFGFLLLDRIIEDYKFEAKGIKFKSEIFTGEIDGSKVIAIKPQTFMNLSGRAAIEVANFYKIPLSNILTLHDDVDLDFARIRFKIGGGAGGHNGLKSLDGSLGKDYMRLRLGVGRPESREFATSDYVLGKFTKSEMEEVGIINSKISDLIGLILEGKPEEFSNKFYLK
jgi:PTH1 family peptidyl-tRNA hydrolase